MNKFVVGDKVKVTIQPDIIFEIVCVNLDNSYEIEYQLSSQQIFRYGNIAAEMLKKVESD